MYSCTMIDRDRFPSEILCGTQAGVEGDLFGEVREESIPLHFEPCLVRELSPLKDLRAIVRLTRFMQRGRFDIVHVHTSKAGILGRLAARWARVPIVVFTAHGWNFNAEQPGWLSTLYLALERLCGRWAHAMVFVADSDRRLALRHRIGDPARYHTIRSGVRLETFAGAARERTSVRHELGLPIEAFVIGSVGRLGTQKAPLDLMTAFRKVAIVAPQAHLLYVGDGPQRERLEGEIRDAGLQDRVRILGVRRDVARLQSAFDTLALASRWEGLPRVFPQAMAAGLPIVATRVDGATDVIEDGVNGWLVELDDLEGFAERLLRLIRDPALARRMGEAGRQRSEAFSARRMVDDLAALYERLAVERASTTAGSARGPGA